MKKKSNGNQDVLLSVNVWPEQDKLAVRKIAEATGQILRTAGCVNCTSRLCEGNQALCSKGIPNPDGKDRRKSPPKEVIVLSRKQAEVFRSFETETLASMI